VLTCAQVMKIDKEIGEISEMTVKFIIFCVNILNHGGSEEFSLKIFVGDNLHSFTSVNGPGSCASLCKVILDWYEVEYICRK